MNEDALHVSVKSNKTKTSLFFYCKAVMKKTGILWYRRNLNKGKFYTRRKEITLITTENVLLEGEEMVCYKRSKRSFI